MLVVRRAGSPVTDCIGLKVNLLPGATELRIIPMIVAIGSGWTSGDHSVAISVVVMVSFLTEKPWNLTRSLAARTRKSRTNPLISMDGLMVLDSRIPAMTVFLSALADAIWDSSAVISDWIFWLFFWVRYLLTESPIIKRIMRINIPILMYQIDIPCRIIGVVPGVLLSCIKYFFRYDTTLS